MIDVVELSRLQFALTAMFHFLFVPLTIGMSCLLAIMESIYVLTGKQIYQNMTRFWGKLFGINFALGVTTGLTMEFQFGTNWSYYSHYVGDIFGAPLAIEALVAFFLESTFVGLFFFGWSRLSKRQHLLITWLVALGSSFSALWILVANGWMQNPVGAEFNYQTMRMEMASFAEVVLNPVAQVKFLHTVASAYTCGAMFILGVSSYYLLQGRDIEFARRSFAIAATFGMAAIISVIVLGDESGYKLGDVQKVKLAAIEAEWHTEPAPAAFTLFGLPNQKEGKTDYAIKIPYLMGLIATRSFDEQVTGLHDLRHEHLLRIRNGMVAYQLLERLQAGDASVETQRKFEQTKHDLGYGLLLKRYTDTITDANEAQIQQAADDSMPTVWPLFWSFRIMVGCGFIMLFVFGAALLQTCRQRITHKPWVLKAALWSIPLPWIAIEAGWFVAEYGRQPWAIGEVLPVTVAVSSQTIENLITSLAIILSLYTVFIFVESYLIVTVARKGPSSLKTGRYHGEQSSYEHKLAQQVQY